MKQLSFALALLAVACGNVKEESVVDSPDTAPDPRRVEADHITVDHILIGVRGAPRMSATRSVEEARTLAEDIVKRVEAGDSWMKLKNEFSDDRSARGPGGPYAMANRGVTPNAGEARRDGMVPGFGDTSFALEVDEIGIAPWDSRKSPFGFHIIKRIK
ncbi:MAG: peptidylprolyl isomerase [Planctomycetota bacterium]